MLPQIDKKLATELPVPSLSLLRIKREVMLPGFRIPVCAGNIRLKYVSIGFVEEKIQEIVALTVGTEVEARSNLINAGFMTACTLSKHYQSLKASTMA